MNQNNLPVCFKEKFRSYLNVSISNLPWSAQRPLEVSLNSHRVVRDLAAKFPQTHWSDSKVRDMLNQESPARCMLDSLGVLNRTLLELIDCMISINFWPGLTIFLEPFPPQLQKDIPRQMKLVTGDPLELVCKAAGIPAPRYQWFYKDDEGIKRIPGQVNPTLHISNPRSYAGTMIVCSIVNNLGKQYNIYTSVCTLEIANDERPALPKPNLTQQPSAAPERPLTEFIAKDKVALLIGNGYYDSLGDLNAPPNDIRQIGCQLQEMQFKVIACENIGMREMHQIIDFFISLLTEGVYGVLYFAGHGFEIQYGHCFLVPSDAPAQAKPEHCISTREVHTKVLKTNPALCLLMLDICRVRKRQGGHGQFSENFIVPQSNSSTMIVYATNENKQAYEVIGSSNPLSIFASYLLKHLRDPSPLWDMMNNVITAIATSDLARKNQQSPEVHTTLAEKRSLHDPIDQKGETAIFSKSLALWDSVNKLPKLKKLDVPELGITITMYFTHEVSNSLQIFIACTKKDRQRAHMATGYVCKIHGRLHANAEVLERSRFLWPDLFKNNEDCLSVTRNTIKNLECQDSELKIDVSIDGTTADGQKKSRICSNINLGWPLFASMNTAPLWQPKPQRRFRTPEQHEEVTAIENDESYYEEVPVPENSMSHSSSYRYPGSMPSHKTDGQGSNDPTNQMPNIETLSVTDSGHSYAEPQSYQNWPTSMPNMRQGHSGAPSPGSRRDFGL